MKARFDAQRFGVKPNGAGSRSGATDVLTADLGGNRPGCVFGQHTIGGETNAQNIVAEGEDLQQQACVAHLDTIRKSFAGIGLLRGGRVLPGLWLLAAGGESRLNCQTAETENKQNRAGAVQSFPSRYRNLHSSVLVCREGSKPFLTPHRDMNEGKAILFIAGNNPTPLDNSP